MRQRLRLHPPLHAPEPGPMFFAAVETTRLIPTHAGTTIVTAID